MHYLSSPKPLLCRELVGRQHELWALGEALEQAARGQPQFVLLAGEAGVGKTKLCRIFMEASQAQQALVLFGQAISQDQALPFAPFLDAFRRYFSTASGRLALARSSLLQANFAFLLDLLPELALLFAAVGSSTFEAAGPAMHRQQALFHRVLAGLEAMAQEHAGPLLLVLEDLHWADETSLDLLAFLAQRLAVNAAPIEPSTPLMILGTYRREALPETLCALQAQIAALQQQVVDLTSLLQRQLHPPASSPTPAPQPKQTRRPPTSPAPRSRPAASATAKTPPRPTHVIPRVEYGHEGRYVVICPKKGRLPFEPDTPEWFAWVAKQSSFRFVGRSGHFTAHHEWRVPRGAWRAHRQIRNQNHIVRLAPNQELTLAVLEQAAEALQAHLTTS